VKKAIVFFLALTIVACHSLGVHDTDSGLSAMKGTGVDISLDNVGQDNHLAALYESFVPYVAIDELDVDMPEVAEVSTQNESVSLVRIHEDMPEFTVTRIVGDLCTMPCLDIPEPRGVSIVIEDNEGNIIQVIPGLTQSNSHAQTEIVFDDYNFDGFLDMKLLRWQEGAGQLRAVTYFWLWDTDEYRYVLNEQLIEIGFTAEINANSDTKQVGTFRRGGGDFLSQIYDFYEFYDGGFVHILQVIYAPVNNEYGDTLREITRININTGETTKEIESSIYE
jgi:hypothetical protein